MKNPASVLQHFSRWPLVITLALLGTWEIASRVGWVSALFFPPPTAIVAKLVSLAVSGKLWPIIEISLYRLFVAVALGAGTGLVVGWLMGANRLIRTALEPFVAAFHPMPKLAIFPIFLVILGIGETSKIALVAVSAFFPMLINTLAGVQQIDRAYWEVAANYGASKSTLLRRVILPGSLPSALTGLRLALNNGLIITIAVEMLSAQQGLGAFIWLAWQTLRTTDLYAALSIIAALGLAGNFALDWLTHFLIPWQGKEKHHE
jgi:NitT/TauT family transport system permease protein